MKEVSNYEGRYFQDHVNSSYDGDCSSFNSEFSSGSIKYGSLDVSIETNAEIKMEQMNLWELM